MPGLAQKRVGIGRGDLNRLGRDLADPDMIRMLVHPIRSEGDHRARPQIPDLENDIGEHGLLRRLDQRPWVVVLGCTRHPRVAVRQEPDCGNVHDAHRPPQLAFPNRPECRRRAQRRVADFTGLAARCAHQTDPQIADPGPGHQSAERERFVVGMSKDEQDIDVRIRGLAVGACHYVVLSGALVEADNCCFEVRLPIACRSIAGVSRGVGNVRLADRVARVAQ